MDQNKAEKEMMKVKECYERVFSTPDGKVVFNDLMKYCGVEFSQFDTDSNTMAFKCGIQDVGLKIKQMIKPMPEFKKNEVIS